MAYVSDFTFNGMSRIGNDSCSQDINSIQNSHLQQEDRGLLLRMITQSILLTNLKLFLHIFPELILQILCFIL